MRMTVSTWPKVENNRTSVLVILAGYRDKMERLMRMDPGLDRRFPKRLVLPNYEAIEIAKICEIKANREFDRKFEPGLIEKLAKHIKVCGNRLFGGGRTIM